MDGFGPIQEISPIEFLFHNFDHYRNYVHHDKFILRHNAQVPQTKTQDWSNEPTRTRPAYSNTQKLQ